MTDIELSWLAGLLEGEGSFLMPPPSKSNSPRIALQMTDRDVVERAAHLMGVNYIHEKDPKKEGWKVTYRICVQGSRAMELMWLLRPYMGERRASKITEILESVVIGKPGDNSRKLTREQVDEIRRIGSTKTVSELSRMFKVSRVVIREILKGTMWR
jgi:hypothetical protein